MLQICRTCLNQLSNPDFVSLRQDNSETLTIRNKLSTCIPKLDLTLVIDPVMCISCVTALNLAFNFKVKCLQAETGIRKILESEKLATNSVKLTEVYHFLSSPGIPVFMQNLVPELGNDVADSKVDVRYDSVEVSTFETSIEDVIENKDVKFEPTVDSNNVFGKVENIEECNVKSEVKVDDNINMLSNYKYQMSECVFDIEKHKLEDFDFKQEDVVSEELFREHLAVMDGKRCGFKKRSSKFPAFSVKKSSVEEETENKCCENSKQIDCSNTKLNGNNVDKQNTKDGEANPKCSTVLTPMTKIKIVKGHNRINKPTKSSKKSIGTEEKSYKCSVCNYRNAHKSKLMIHVRVHTGEKPFHCAICDYRCAEKPNLIKHMKSHTGEKPYQCAECDYRSAWKKDLVRHFKIHTGDKPFQCLECNHKSARKQDLVKHMRIHQEEKFFKCTICDCGFSQRIRLLSHMKAHAVKDSFKCGLCTYVSVDKQYLQRHMKIHTKEKPFPCTKCNYKAARKEHLRRHLKTHTASV